MRKKYLSALLFGALLFASAGTFTSCKDYDDDINNLQEQIDVIVADLNDLKTLVGDGGVSSVTFDEATGVLTVVDAAGTKTYNVKTPAAEVGEVKVVIDDERNLVVNDEVIGKVGDVVTVNAEGYLCVNGVATEIKAGKYAILENESDNTYTITLPDAEGNMQTITLLKSVATNIALEVIENAELYSIFSEINATGSDAKEFQENNGIAWGVAPSDIDWDGPKGAVKAGQLLVGQQNTVQVRVTPQNVELDKQALALVDYDGNVAPVTVVPTTDSNNPGNTGSRAVAKGGLWNLNITMNSTVTASTIGTDFAQRIDKSGKEDFDDWANKKYALRVNGNIVTPYDFVIDTDPNACPMTDDDELTNDNAIIKVDGKEGTGTDKTEFNVSLGSRKLTLEQASVYDYKFEIVDADKNDAEAWGITLENNVLTAPNNATAAGKTIHLNVVLLGVNGQKYSYKYADESSPITVTFKAASSSAITLPVSTYKVTPEEYAKSIYNNTATDKKYATITLDMGDLFSGLTAQEAIAIQESATSTTNPGEFSLTTKDETFVFLRESIVAKYNEVGEGKTICFYEADGKTPVAFDDTKADIRRIKYAKVIYNMSNKPEELWNPKATLGEHILTMVLEDAAGNQIRKANIPVNVTIPTFFELFTKSGAWTDSNALAVVDENGKIALKQLYNDKTKGANTFDAAASWFIADNKVAGEISTPNTENVVQLNKEAVTSSHTLKDLASGLVYHIVPECPAFTVSSGDFTMDVITKLDAAKFVYYGEDGKETNIIVQPETKNEIPAYKVNDGVKTGLSFYKAGTDNVFRGGVVVNGFELHVAEDVTYSFDDNAGDKAEAKFANGVLTVSGLAAGNYTTVLTVTYTKASAFAGVQVYETFEIPLTVQAGK